MLKRIKEVNYDTDLKKFVLRDERGRKTDVSLGGGGVSDVNQIANLQVNSKTLPEGASNGFQSVSELQGFFGDVPEWIEKITLPPGGEPFENSDATNVGRLKESGVYSIFGRIKVTALSTPTDVPVLGEATTPGWEFDVTSPLSNDLLHLSADSSWHQTIPTTMYMPEGVLIVPVLYGTFPTGGITFIFQALVTRLS